MISLTPMYMCTEAHKHIMIQTHMIVCLRVINPKINWTPNCNLLRKSCTPNLHGNTDSLEASLSPRQGWFGSNTDSLEAGLSPRQGWFGSRTETTWRLEPRLDSYT